MKNSLVKLIFGIILLLPFVISFISLYLFKLLLLRQETGIFSFCNVDVWSSISEIKGDITITLFFVNKNGNW